MPDRSPAIPTVALTPASVPASHTESSHPFFRFDGYAESGENEAMTAIMNRAIDEGLDALSLHELRIELFRTRRAQRHGGGPYGDDDPYDRHMAAALDLIRKRVSARGGGVGLWRGDLTAMHVDAVVNAANAALSGGGGVDGAIQRAAGPELLEACRQIEEVSPAVRCPTGEARITPGFRLPAEHVVHAVGPVWHGGERGEPDLLASAYRASLDLASGAGAKSVAFPALSTGAYNYPAFEAALVAAETCRDWLAETDVPIRIVLVAFDANAERSIRAALRRVVRP